MLTITYDNVSVKGIRQKSALSRHFQAIL